MPAVPVSGPLLPVRPPLPPWLPFEWIVATRFLKEGRMQTAFIAGGIAIGVGVIVFMSALLVGVQSNIVNRVLTGQPHIQLLPPKEVARPLRQEPGGAIEGAIVQPPLQRLKGIDQWQNIVQQIRGWPDVNIVSPGVSGSALAVRGEASRAISINGVEPTLYYRIVPMDDKIVRGSSRLTGTDVLIGTELADTLGVGVGDKLRVTAATGAANTLQVTGIFDLGNKGANLRTTYVALHTAQSLLGLPGGVTNIDVTVRDVYAAEVVAQRITATTGVEADSWIRTNEQFFTAMNTQSTVNLAIRFFVALSVAFGIASVLVVSVVQKSREIGILRAMGITRGQVLRIFLLQGGMLGFLGACLGSLLGAAALLGWQQFARNADGTSMFMVTFDPMLFLAALALATVTGLAAAFLPARRAARLDPVVAIRG